MGHMLDDSRIRCEMIGYYSRAVRCVYETSHEGQTKTVGAKINCLMSFNTMFADEMGQGSEWKWWRKGCGALRKSYHLRLSPRALFRQRSSH